MTNQQIMAEAIRVVNQAFLGMLTTVDPDGAPHARWMGSATAENGLHRIFTLTDKKARKVGQIVANPRVSWVFSTEGYSDVVTLHGRAQVIYSPIVAQQVFDRLQDYARTWCLGALGGSDDDLEMVAVETTMTRLEYVSPRLKMYTPRIIDLPPRED